jgi:hypothetical protein
MIEQENDTFQAAIYGLTLIDDLNKSLKRNEELENQLDFLNKKMVNNNSNFSSIKIKLTFKNNIKFLLRLSFV